MNVLVMPAAEADLLAIGMWIAEDNPVRAETFLRELREACRSIGDTPRAYPVLGRYRRVTVRRRTYRDYLIFYRIGKEQVEVVHVLHGARDYEAILSQNPRR
jgi:plasmid stabilization system protein ParE